MKSWMSMAAALALVAGIGAANAQGTPGAGAPGQDQRPQIGTKTAPESDGAAKTQDAPTSQSGTATSPSKGTTGAAPSGSGMSGSGSMSDQKDQTTGKEQGAK